MMGRHWRGCSAGGARGIGGKRLNGGGGFGIYVGRRGGVTGRSRLGDGERGGDRERERERSLASTDGERIINKKAIDLIRINSKAKAR